VRSSCYIGRKREDGLGFCKLLLGLRRKVSREELGTSEGVEAVSYGQSDLAKFCSLIAASDCASYQSVSFVLHDTDLVLTFSCCSSRACVDTRVLSAVACTSNGVGACR